MHTINEHLAESKMTYWYHCKHGIVNGTKLLLGALASYIHSFFPQLFSRYSIMTVIKLYHDIKRHHHIQKIEKKWLESKNVKG